MAHEKTVSAESNESQRPLKKNRGETQTEASHIYIYIIIVLIFTMGVGRGSKTEWGIVSFSLNYMSSWRLASFQLFAHIIPLARYSVMRG